MIVLGIETSCDETAVAIVDSKKNILSNKLLSQTEHEIFGGVVPEIAARSHLEYLPFLFNTALKETNLNIYNLDAIAVTAGPGLIGGVIVGLMFAKAISSIAQKPLIAVNHLEGHALTVRFSSDIKFPYLLLLISGGHCQILIVKGVGLYQQLGQTIDDSIGETFDKTARMLGLGYPGGPIIEELAKKGNPLRFDFPKPLCDQHNCNFSFSGLKTAIKYTLNKIPDITLEVKADICASLQYTISKIIIYKLEIALKLFSQIYPNSNEIVIAGGVAANQYIRNSLSAFLATKNINLIAPPIELCTDNAVMISWTGIERLQLKLTNKLDFEPKSRWPLTDL